MQILSALNKDQRIVIVHGMLTATTEVIVSASLGVAVALVVSGTSLGLLWYAVAGAMIILACALVRVRGNRTKRAEIARAAEKQAQSLAPLQLPALDVSRWRLPARVRGLAMTACTLAARAHISVSRFSTLATIGVLVVPGLLVMGDVTGNLGAARVGDWLVLNLAVLGPTLVVRTQLITVGSALLRSQTEPSLNQALFPG